MNSSAPHRRPLRWSLTLGRVASIHTSVHITFFILVALVAAAGAQPGGLGIVGALLWLVLIFACVLVHELAQGIVARAKGDARALV